MGPYVVQLLPDQEGATALRKVIGSALRAEEEGIRVIQPPLDPSELDALYALYAKLTNDMRRRT